MAKQNIEKVIVCPKCGEPSLYFYNKECNHPVSVDDITHLSCVCGYSKKVITILKEDE